MKEVRIEGNKLLIEENEVVIRFRFIYFGSYFIQELRELKDIDCLGQLGIVSG